MLPSEDQITSSPPRSVKMREVPTITLPLVKIEILPPCSVRMPWSIGWLPEISKPTVSWPPGAKRLISPPLAVLTSREVSEKSPCHFFPGKSAAIAAKPAS